MGGALYSKLIQGKFYRTWYKMQDLIKIRSKIRSNLPNSRIQHHEREFVFLLLIHTLKYQTPV